MHPISQISFLTNNQAYVVEASAGTGKTWTIERLFVKALLERNQLSLEKILVVTFTNDAVSELKERILGYINSIVETLGALKCGLVQNDIIDTFVQEVILPRRMPLEKDISILSSAAQNFDCASIFTIHGFCNKVLTNYQFLCNISHPFKLIKNKNSMIKRLITNFFRHEIINNPQFISSMGTIYQNLEQALPRDTDNGDFIAPLVRFFCRDNIVKFNNNQVKIGYSILDKPDLNKLMHLNLTYNGRDELIIKQLQKDKDELLYHLYSAIAKYIAVNFDKYYKQTAQLDFNDLVEIVADRVVTSRDLADKIFSDYPVVFIDEFQDTDKTQWQIFQIIYQLNTKQKRGNVIVVGDPKQAIYRFRGADIHIYLEAKLAINNTLMLNENRRSHKNIVNFINQLFSTDNNPNCFGLGIDYTLVNAAIDSKILLQLPSKSLLQSVLNDHNICDYTIHDAEVQIVTITGESAEVKEEQLLMALTTEILLLLKADSNLAKNIAILVNKNEEAIKVVRHLSQYGVRASLYQRDNVFATHTASDFYRVLESIIDLSNVSLMQIALATNLFNIPYTHLEAFINDSSLILGGSSIAEQFFSYKLVLSSNNIMSLIYMLINDLKAISQHYGVVLINRDVANLLQLGEIIQKRCMHMSSHELLYWLNNKIATSKYSDLDLSDVELDGTNEELVRLDNGDDQIKVITQHKSKGLEFAIVFCPYFKSNVYNISELNHLNSHGMLKKSELRFLRYKDNHNLQQQILSYDTQLLKLADEEENNEINRLNYVALTRAKSRLYIYLTDLKAKKGDKYHSATKPRKIDELFGFKSYDVNDISHNLFNYPLLFKSSTTAIKAPHLLPGVSIYTRQFVNDDILIKLKKLECGNLSALFPVEVCLKTEINQRISYRYQSYSSLTAMAEKFHIIKNNVLDSKLNVLDSKLNVLQEDLPVNITNKVSYRYPILNQLKGIKFGLLIHSLCENYPLTVDITNHLLIKANIDIAYCDEVMSIIREIFNYKLLMNRLSLARIDKKISELGFNLVVKKTVSINHDIKEIIRRFYGESHPFVNECAKLNILSSGFLTGFIDLLFEDNGKFFVLDYKTNSLPNYTSCFDVQDMRNELLLETARSHYYLQYLLYLVATKRYLEFRLNIPDATNLLGGAIYFYIRGIFIEDANKAGGILFDGKCQMVISALDGLFKH